MSEPTELNDQMPLREQIERQAGQDVVRLHLGGTSGIVTVTADQAQMILDGGELIVDPLTRAVTVRAC